MGWACSRKAGGGGAHCKGPGCVTELALLSLSTRSPHTFNSAEETCNVRCSPLGWGAAPYNTRWMRRAAGAHPLGTGTHTGFTWLEPHPLLCLVCKGRRGGLVQETHLISGRNTTSAYLMQLRSSCKDWRGEGHGKGPRGPHRHAVMCLPPHFCES